MDGGGRETLGLQRTHVSHPGLEVHSSLSSLIARLAGSKSLRGDQGRCLHPVSLRRCATTQTKAATIGGGGESRSGREEMNVRRVWRACCVIKGRPHQTLRLKKTTSWKNKTCHLHRAPQTGYAVVQQGETSPNLASNPSASFGFFFFCVCGGGGDKQGN